MLRTAETGKRNATPGRARRSPFVPRQPESAVPVRSAGHAPGAALQERSANVAAQLDAQVASGKCACGGGCPRCRGGAPGPQAFAAGAARDRHEAEADRVADRVVRMPGGSPRRARAQASRGDAGPSRGGQALDRHTRTFMESRFGYDFGVVRVHTGAGAAAAAAAEHARAYTLGADIVFAAGAYAPHTFEGRWLLAHELTHTVQQGAAAPRAAGPTIGILGGAPPGIQRVGECAGKPKPRCSGSCVHSSGIAGFCTWSGTIANGCICIARDQPMLRQAEQVLFDLIVAALIVAGIVLTAAAIAAIIACLLGPCEVAALVALVGFAAAMIIIGIIEGAGGGEGGETPIA